MIKKFKDLLGIEGVKVKLIVPDEIVKKDEKVSGILKFTSLSDQTISGFTVSLIEKYARGGGDDRLINEYILGRANYTDRIEIRKDETVEIDFVLSFVSAQSDMDKMESSNIFYKLLAKTAKYLKKVKSSYHIEVTANVESSKLDAIDKVAIVLI